MLFSRVSDDSGGGWYVCPTCGGHDVHEVHDTPFNMSLHAGDDDTCMSEFVQCVDCGTWEEV
jgi:hypothetical protein